MSLRFVWSESSKATRKKPPKAVDLFADEEHEEHEEDLFSDKLPAKEVPPTQAAPKKKVLHF